MKDCGYTIKETMVLPENSLILKTQILRLADIKAFDVICFLDEDTTLMKNALIEMAEESCFMKCEKEVQLLKRKQTWMVYLQSSDSMSQAEWCDFFTRLQNGSFDMKKEQSR